MNKHILSVFILLLVSVGVWGQKYGYYGASKADEHWSIGVHGGAGLLLGDVAGSPAIQGGIMLEKVVSPWFSVRLNGNYGQYRGQDFTATTDIRDNSALNGTRDSIIVPYLAFDTVNTRVFMNYNMQSVDFSLQGKVNVIRLLSASYQGGFDFYGFGGIGYQFYGVKMDMAKNGVQYDFSQITATDKVGVLSQLAALQDGEFETIANNSKQLGILGYRNFSLSGGIGIRQRVGNHFAVGLESRYVFVQDDQLDGKQFPIPAQNAAYKVNAVDALATGSLFFQVLF